MNYSLIDEHSVATQFLAKKNYEHFCFYLCKSIKNSTHSGIAGWKIMHILNLDKCCQNTFPKHYRQSIFPTILFFYKGICD